MNFRSKKEILSEISTLKSKGKKIVFTNGCFDIIHVGHLRYLREARALGDYLVVGLNSDLSVKAIKGPSRPVNSELDRAEVLLSLRQVDGVVIFSEETPYELIREIQPDILVKGGDWKPDQIVGSDLVLARGGVVKSLLLVEGRSTTKTIERIRQTK